MLENLLTYVAGNMQEIEQIPTSTNFMYLFAETALMGVSYYYKMPFLMILFATDTSLRAIRGMYNIGRGEDPYIIPPGIIGSIRDLKY